MAKEIAILQDSEIRESFSEMVRTRLAELSELVEIDFLQVGEQYPVEQIFDQDNPDSFGLLPKEKQDEFLKIVGELLGGNFANVASGAAIREFPEEGIDGQPSENGGTVRVFTLPEDSGYSFFELHVVDYDDPSLGRKYLLARRV